MNRILLLVTLLFSLGNSQTLDCDNGTTYDLIECKKIEILKAEKNLNIYWERSQQRYKDNEEILSHMYKSQEIWVAYKKAHCNTIYQIWIDGTIRGLMHVSCLLNMTNKRTHEIWETYLTYMDSTPPILDEPK